MGIRTIARTIASAQCVDSIKRPCPYLLAPPAWRVVREGIPVALQYMQNESVVL